LIRFPVIEHNETHDLRQNEAHVISLCCYLLIYIFAPTVSSNTNMSDGNSGCLCFNIRLPAQLPA